MPRTHKIKVYQFAELDDAAKEKARDWYRRVNSEWFDADDFKENTLEAHVAYHHRVKTTTCHFSLSYCQGDGVAFYGAFDLDFFMSDPEPGMGPPEGGKLAKDREDIRRLVRQMTDADFTLDVRIDGEHDRYHHHNSMSVRVDYSGGPDYDGRRELVREVVEELFGDEPTDTIGVSMLHWIDAEPDHNTPILVLCDALDDLGVAEYAAAVARVRAAYVTSDEWERLVGNLQTALDEYMTAVSPDAEEVGYKELEYQDSDEVVDENISINEYEFTADGKRFVTPRSARKKRR